MQVGVDSQRAVENRRIFVIDDDDITRTALQFMLADENETHAFERFEAAIEKSRDWPPDLILFGSGAVRRLGPTAIAAARARFGHARLLLVAESSDDPNIDIARAEGADGFITLPLKLETVRRKVDLALGRPVPLDVDVVRR